MPSYNAVTITATGQLFRYGSSNFENDGSFDAGSQTYYANIGSRPDDVVLKYLKIQSNQVVEMDQSEKDVVDAVLTDPNKDYHPLLYPTGEVETLSSDGVSSLYCYASKIDTTNLVLTLADGNMEYQAKIIQTLGGSSCTVTCTLSSPNVSFTLGANNKAQIMWHTDGGVSAWKVIDSKGITFNT